jgi:hypothetical protein
MLIAIGAPFLYLSYVYPHEHRGTGFMMVFKRTIFITNEGNLQKNMKPIVDPGCKKCCEDGTRVNEIRECE